MSYRDLTIRSRTIAWLGLLLIVIVAAGLRRGVQLRGSVHLRLKLAERKICAGALRRPIAGRRRLRVVRSRRRGARAADGAVRRARDLARGRIAPNRSRPCALSW